MGNAKQIILEQGEPTEQSDDRDIQEGEVVAPPPAEKAVTVPAAPQSTALAASTGGQMSPNDLRGMIAYETEMRGVISEYLAKNMKPGVDFDKIHINKDCPYKSQPGNCPQARHFSKPTLLKPGAEKFTSLFKLSAVFRRDDETWEMAGKPAGLFCYVCELRAADGKILSEGRGACSPQEKMGNMNSAIKIAQKRAQVDATLRFGALSDIFTQDMEDLVTMDQPAAKNSTPQTVAVNKTTVIQKNQVVSTSKPVVATPVVARPPVAAVPTVPKLTEAEKAQIVEQKKEINKLCLDYNPMLSTAAEFSVHVKQMTGLELTTKNYAAIITKLRASPPPADRKKMVESIRKAKAAAPSPA